MATHKQEAVTASFHYLCRRFGDDDSGKIRPFTQSEFDSLFNAIRAKPKLDQDDEKQMDLVRLRQDVPMSEPVRVEPRIVAGTFRAGYSGHAYDNTAKGLIPADSVSLRPFHYLLYLSKGGLIYVGSQYLGQFGGYQALQRTLISMLGGGELIESHSLRVGASYYKNLQAKEVQVTFTEASKSISKKNKLGQSGMIVLRKQSKHDGFEDEVKEKLLPHIGKPQPAVRKAVAAIFSDSDLIDVNDGDIEDCTVIGRVDGKKRTLYMLDPGTFATRFPLNVGLDANGHPKFEPTKNAMIAVLKEDVAPLGPDA